MKPIHPEQALFSEGRSLPLISSCDHYAGSEKFIRKAFALQREKGAIFDVTCDLEDGAAVGDEEAHAHRIADLIIAEAPFAQACGIRIHDPAGPYWERDLAIVMPKVLNKVRYITIPKVRAAADVRKVSSKLQTLAASAGQAMPWRLHILIETHGALRDVWDIAAIPNIEALEFGLLDFISGHYGAIPEQCMRSPGQFEQRLIVRAKQEMVAAALANAVIPTHNITVAFNDAAQTCSDAARAFCEFGFLRMWSIHPAQIEPIIKSMQAPLSIINDAQEILLAGYAGQWKPIHFKAQLHDRASYRYYWEIIKRARLLGQALRTEVEQAFFFAS